MDLIALMPWWIGVALAIALYWILHAIASRPIIPSTHPGHAGTMATAAILQGLALAGQYALPIICLAGSLVSACRRNKRRNLVANAAQAQASHMIDGMTWREFEMLIGEAFRLRGYKVTETGGGGADGGVDLILTKANEKFLVQCKQWRAFNVGVDVVRELYGVMAARGATGGFVVTSGSFTQDAIAFASGRNIDLLDAPKLAELLRQVKSPARSASARAVTSDSGASPIANMDTPSCPTCGKSMVRRTAKRGAKAGNPFWGCADYPGCRGTRPVS